MSVVFCGHYGTLVWNQHEATKLHSAGMTTTQKGIKIMLSRLLGAGEAATKTGLD